MSTHNATLSYKADGDEHSFPFWVMEFNQPLMLSGSSYQSRNRKHFYPRAHMPGDITVKGRCASQREYQRMAHFIRKHQRDILNTPSNERFSRINTSNPGYHRLLRLSIPSEPLFVRGWINSFSIDKKGVMAPAPEYTFNFFIVFDQSAVDMGISHRIQQYYTGNTSGRVIDPFEEQLETSLRDATDAARRKAGKGFIE